MRRKNDYILRKIANVPYLLPCGQAAADLKRGVQLNHTGAWLWQLMEEDHTQEELLGLFGAHFASSPEDMPFLKKDLSQFLHILQSYGMILSHGITESGGATPCCFLEIGGLCLKITGPKETISAHFDAFVVSHADIVHQTIFIHSGIPCRRLGGELLLHNQNLAIYDSGDFYVLNFPSMEQIGEVHLAKDASLVDFYCTPPWDESFRENLFHAIRLVFLYLAQKHHMAALHSASLLYRDKAWLFSGCSGMGKSTHTNLWHELLRVPLLNGDLNLLAMENGKPVIHGLPWCGTSGISDNATHPLGGIVLLKQARDDYMEELSQDARRLLVLQRLISPHWTSEQLDLNLGLVEELAGHIYIAQLHCTKAYSAVETAQKSIDTYLDIL